MSKMAVLGLGLYNLFILRIINVNGKSLQGYTVYIETFVCVCVFGLIFDSGISEPEIVYCQSGP